MASPQPLQPHHQTPHLQEQREQQIPPISHALASIDETQQPPWYKTDIGPRLKNAGTRRVLERSSGLHGADLEGFLYAIRERAWSIQKYPCIGQFAFLTSHTPQLPCYAQLVARLQAGASLLDVGCGFGQDLRFLAAGGAPTGEMWGVDIEGKFWEMGFEVFGDRGRMGGRFLEGDLFDDDWEGMRELIGVGMDVVLVANFLHMFGWEMQVDALRRLVGVCRPGAWIVGYQVGSDLGREVKVGACGATGKAGVSAKLFHNVESFGRLWREVEERTGTEWMVEASMWALSDWGLEVEDFEWMGPFARGLQFIATRQK